jgi:CheY-like chemotaxis protein
MVTRHVLIVDDEPKVGYFLRKALELSKRDCRVSTARTGEEALEILERDHVDLLVTDLRMPGVSGLDLMRWVKTRSPGTSTILITAYGNEEIKVEARRLEVYEYLTKPFNVKDFTQIVDGALKNLAASTPGYTIISDQTFEMVNERLERLCNETGAHCAFLADMQGQRLAEVGPVAGLDTTMLLTLLAGGFVTSAELARRFNRGRAANLLFQEGEDYDICSSNVGDNLLVALIFEKTTQKGRLGMVWLYTRRAITDLLSLLSSTENRGSNHALADDFGTSVMAELESAFDGSFAGPASGPDAGSRAQPPSFGTEMPVISRSSARSSTRADIGIERPYQPETVTPPAGKDREPSRQAAEGLLTLEEAMARGLLPPGFEKPDIL